MRIFDDKSFLIYGIFRQCTACYIASFLKIFHHSALLFITFICFFCLFLVICNYTCLFTVSTDLLSRVHFSLCLIGHNHGLDSSYLSFVPWNCIPLSVRISSNKEMEVEVVHCGTVYHYYIKHCPANYSFMCFRIWDYLVSSNSCITIMEIGKLFTYISSEFCVFYWN